MTTNQPAGRPLPLVATRLNSFSLGGGLAHPPSRPPVIDLIRTAGTVEGLDALELNYPEHFVDTDVDTVAAAAKDAGIAITGIQLRWPAPRFARGAFTADQQQDRDDAVRMACAGADVCHALGAQHVVLWPAHDGYEYPFQLDYARAWQEAARCYAAVADHAAGLGLDVSIEYKPAEPRARTLLESTGSVLALIAELGRPNLHVTLDFAHLLMAHENLAQSVAVSLAHGRLRGLQLNDGWGAADDGLMVGSVHLVQTLEAFFYLVRDGYAGTLYFDTDPVRENPLAECRSNIVRTTALWELAARLVAAGQVPTQDAIAAGAAWWQALVADHGPIS